MAVTMKTIDDIRWPDDAEFDEHDSFLAIVVLETPADSKMDSTGLHRDIVMLGHGYETIEEVSHSLLRRVESGAVDFDPGWARLVKTDGVVDFGTDTYDPQ